MVSVQIASEIRASWIELDACYNFDACSVFLKTKINCLPPSSRTGVTVQTTVKRGFDRGGNPVACIQPLRERIRPSRFATDKKCRSFIWGIVTMMNSYDNGYNVCNVSQRACNLRVCRGQSSSATDVGKLRKRTSSSILSFFHVTNSFRISLT